MEWNLSVPKIFHVYWGGNIIPHIRFLTVKSFMQQNPDWTIMFWYPRYPTNKITWRSGELDYEVNCRDFTSELMHLPIKKIDVDFQEIGFKNDVPENFKSDFLRAHLLSTVGGVWSDMDILYFKPITSLKVNDSINKDIETFVCISGYGHSNGFLMSAKGSKFYESILSMSKSISNPISYQSVGPTLYNSRYRSFDSINSFSPAVNMEMDTVYSFDANQIPKLLDGTPPQFTDGTIGVHWYAGHPLWGNFMKRTNGGLSYLSNNIIGNLIRKINDGQ